MKTGLKDKNGIEIYKGDTVKEVHKGESFIGKVVYTPDLPLLTIKGWYIVDDELFSLLEEEPDLNKTSYEVVGE